MRFDVEHDFLYLDKLPTLKNNSCCFRNDLPFFVSLVVMSFYLMRWWLTILRQYLIFLFLGMFEIKAKLEDKKQYKCAETNLLSSPPIW